ncbi:hypothetical protein [Caballeronia sp. dw_19]|uniref:hypothetical protein n=1 Tax=Caballeronia sp. dw_19 TaxID=2719791 RepID=UPI001BD40C7A|nr:hypothetical protein [Caballeronia sp. dw_19]
MSTLLAVNIVLLSTQQIDVSVYSQLWFLEAGVVGKDEFLPGSMFLPVMVNLQASPLRVVILPDRVQFSFDSADHALVDDVQVRINRFLDAARLSFKLGGVNVLYALHDGNVPGPYLERSREIFLNGNPLLEDFNGRGATAGVMLRTPDEFGGHLQVEIRSGRASRGGKVLCDNQELLVFNTSQEAPTNKLEELKSMLDRVPQLIERSAQLITKFETTLARAS